MGEALRAALGVGIPEEEFWGLTPYRLITRVNALRRASTEASLMSGWFAERFAREKALRGPSAYVAEMLDGKCEDVDEAAALKDWARRVDAKFKRPVEPVVSPN